MSESGLPPSWEVRHSNSRNLPYYFNKETNDSRWEPPAGTDTLKLKQYMAANHGNHSSQPEEQNNAAKIRAAHLLVKHEESRRASSWKEATITRSKEEARSIIERFEENIRAGDITLAELAKSESDCSSARKGGDLGYFGRGEMQASFERAAFALQVGQMSGIVESESGFHLIERIA